MKVLTSNDQASEHILDQSAIKYQLSYIDITHQAVTGGDNPRLTFSFIRSKN